MTNIFTASAKLNGFMDELAATLGSGSKSVSVSQPSVSTGPVISPDQP